MVADEAGLAVGFSLDNAGPVGSAVPQRKFAVASASLFSLHDLTSCVCHCFVIENVAQKDDLEARLAELRK
jgi:hypothetical protein